MAQREHPFKRSVFSKSLKSVSEALEDKELAKQRSFRSDFSVSFSASFRRLTSDPVHSSSKSLPTGSDAAQTMRTRYLQGTRDEATQLQQRAIAHTTDSIEQTTVQHENHVLEQADGNFRCDDGTPQQTDERARLQGVQGAG
eukprot:1500402-Rhodomonas_salina.3